MKVNNVASWAKEKKFMTIRMVDGEAWFYDAWSDEAKAIAQAVEIGGHVIPIEAVETA